MVTRLAAAFVSTQCQQNSGSERPFSWELEFGVWGVGRCRVTTRSKHQTPHLDRLFQMRQVWGAASEVIFLFESYSVPGPDAFPESKVG